MKAVLISIQPKWCELIASGKKTVEVRKSAPRLETPFKCYIYQTKGMADNKAYNYKTWARRGKVIGEFVCDNIYEWKYECDGVDIDDDTLLETMLDWEEINIYAHGKTLYGWHISELKIYDKPRELREFRAPCNCSCLNCKNPLYDNGVCEERGTKKIIRPFQSWGYVEE